MEEKKQVYSVRDVLEITIRNLEGIMIPVSVADSVGMTIKGSCNNIRECIKIMDLDAQKKAQEEEPELVIDLDQPGDE